MKRIGYVVLGATLKTKQPVVKLSCGASIIEATPLAIEYAVMDRCLRFDDPRRMNMWRTLAFWEWFWTEPAVRDLEAEHGVWVLPVTLRDIAIKRLRSEVTCNG